MGGEAYCGLITLSPGTLDAHLPAMWTIVYFTIPPAWTSHSVVFTVINYSWNFLDSSAGSCLFWTQACNPAQVDSH